MLKSVSKKTEELVNVATAGLGIIISAIALILMVIKSIYSQSIISVIAAVIFGLSLIVTYFMATIFHAEKNNRKKYFLNKLDHSSIYILIAGSYTPVAIVLFQGYWGWGLFFTQWFLAVFGVLYKMFWYKHKYRSISVFAYVVMGSLIILGIKPLSETLPVEAIVWLVTGLLLYTIGMLFYLSNKLKLSHAVWHLFVLLGSTSHFIFNYIYIF